MPQSQPPQKTNKIKNKSPRKKLETKIYIFIGSLSKTSKGRKACYFAAKLGMQLNAIIEIFYIENALSFGQWQQLSETSHNELRLNAQNSIKKIAEIISSSNNKPPVVHYVEPVAKQDINNNLTSLIQAACSEESEKLAYYITEHDPNDPNDQNSQSIAAMIMNISAVQAPKIIIPESISLITIDALFN